MKTFLTSLVLAAVILAPSSVLAQVRTGIDVLAVQNFAELAGKKVALVTNHSGVSSDRRRTIDLLARSGKVELVAIFTPEHGLTGTREDQHIESGKDELTGVPVYSLFNNGTFRPTAGMLRGVDAIVFDIQDAGARFYTFITTLGYTLEAAAENHLSYYVLDRPNPINGLSVEGPMLDSKYFSFIGYMRMPIRHGMTVGELAQMFNAEKNLHADLHIVRMQGWQRSMWFDETGLEWINPSPNLRNLTETILYPGACLLGSHQVSVGRGTDTPFEIIGAPWFHGREVAAYLNQRQIPGVRFLARRFRPTTSVYANQECDGIDIQLTDRNRLDAVRMGLEILSATLRFHPGRVDLESSADSIKELLGNSDVILRLKKGQTGTEINDSFRADVERFLKLRAQYLLY